MPSLFRRRPKNLTQAKPSKLIVGLGNPGSGYSGNRHNVGFMSVNQLARMHDMRFDKSKGEARVAEGEIADARVLLARPQTYMNSSGKSVAALLRKLDLSPEDIVVVHDDLDLPVGRIRVRKGGSAGGHKGIQSIIAEIGTAEFSRVRIGIGRPARVEASESRGRDVIDYVLGDFNAEERATIAETIPRAVEAVECLLEHGLVEAMNRFNATAPTREQSHPGTD